MNRLMKNSNLIIRNYFCLFHSPKSGFHLVTGGKNKLIETRKNLFNSISNMNSYHGSSVLLKQHDNNMSSPKQAFSKEELKERLSPIQYQVTQEKGTERPFTGKYNKCYDSGVYKCIVCHQELFSSETKFDSGCGWPAFNDVLDKGLVKLSKDTSNGRIRTEVQCSKCDAHLGHVFDDGPRPTGKRFCINSASLEFVGKE